MQPISLESLNAIIRRHGFEHFNWTSQLQPLSFSHYTQWLEKDYHGQMTYLERHRSIKQNPQQLLPQIHSFLVLAIPYLPFPDQSQSPPLQSLKVAAYAQGRDYHLWLEEKLSLLINDFKIEFPSAEFLFATDSKPVLERDLAVRAGLGWIGKNTCLIHQKKGSFFFIAEVLTSLKIENSPTLVTDHCGKCTRCLEACPTQALREPRVLDATRCISYWTIEAKSVPPIELRQHFNQWFFGCDICQVVCPWNEKFVLNNTPMVLHKAPQREQVVAELRFIFTATPEQIQSQFAESPLLRPGALRLKRNALIVSANARLIELQSIIESLQFEQSDLHELKAWTLNQLHVQNANTKESS